MSEFSVVSSLVGVADSHDVGDGGWEVGDQGFNSLDELSFVGEEWEVSVDEFNSLAFDDGGVGGDDLDVLGDLGDGGDDGLEVEGFNGFLEGWDEAGQEGGVIDQGHVVVDSDGGVGFFNESEDSDNTGVDVEFDLFGEQIRDGTELSSDWDVLAVEDDGLEDVSNEGADSDEVLGGVGSLDLGSLLLEG